jgi:D-alanyl-D-alanine carboxypeptidase
VLCFGAISAAIALGLMLCTAIQAAEAATAMHHRAAVRAAAVAALPTPEFEWIVLDAENGQVLGEQNADAITYPASLTKMMTLYLTFQNLNQGRIALDTRLPVSPYAASRAPTKLGLIPGETVAVQSLILGIVTKSANDAATVLAEGQAGGSEENFCNYMNWTARQLGMDHTNFANASGLPNPAQHTTARDMVRLALALYHNFPREYRYFATKEFEFRGRLVRGHDHLLDWYPGADGIKTGYINASGFNIATSAVQNGHRLIGVVMGGRTAHQRDLQMASLLNQGFAMLNRGGQGGQAARSTVPVSVAVPPRPPAAPAPAQVPAAAAPAPAPAPAAAAAAAAAATTRPGVVRSALRHLSPIGRAEAAAPATPPPDRAVADDWEIQIGAYRAQAAAAHAAREAAHLAIARGKPRQIVAPVRAAHQRFYRARLLHFTERSAQTACAELRHRGYACMVLRPTEAGRFAS